MRTVDRLLGRIIVDLTPVVPGGANGGAKPLACALVRELSLLAPETQFVLLTSAVSHDELASLDAFNVRRECVDADLAAGAVETGGLSRARVAARVLVNTLVPSERTRTRIKDGVWTVVKRRRRSQVAAALPADLLFCPFTAPFFFDPRVPTVSIVHDLQFVELPEFFEDQKRADRLRHFLDACERADRLICVSDFVRQTVLANSAVSASGVQTIYSAPVQATRAEPVAPDVARGVLTALGMRGSRYLLYPANVWPHKNHRRLVEAFALFRARRSDSDLTLVCTGAGGQAADDLQRLAGRLLPQGSFAYAGFLPEREFGGLLQNCRALIFPSLYEGFGLPLLEAMLWDRPVLCSNVTSLPEVAGAAAVLFDPRNVTAIAEAIQRLESEPGLDSSLIQRGRERLAHFGSARDMAARYLAAFEEVVAARRGVSSVSGGGPRSSR